MDVIWTIAFVAVVGWFFVCIALYVLALFAFSWASMRSKNGVYHGFGQRPTKLGRWPK